MVKYFSGNVKNNFGDDYLSTARKWIAGVFNAPILFAFGSLLILISKRKASPRLIAALVASRDTGLLDLVYLEAVPRLWLSIRLLREFVTPV